MSGNKITPYLDSLCIIYSNEYYFSVYIWFN